MEKKSHDHFNINEKNENVKVDVFCKSSVSNLL